MKNAARYFYCFALSSLLVALLTNISPSFSAGHDSTGGNPSRAPEKGCTWNTIQSTNPKFSVLAQDCDYGFRKITQSFEGTAVVERYSDVPASSEPDKVIEVFSKTDTETPAAALKRLFIDQLQPYEKEHCVAVQSKSKDIVETPLKDPQKSVWVIMPDKEYAAKIKKDTVEGDMPEDSCGNYGLPVDSRAYFEFHAKSPGTFAWVVIGQDTPLFDEQSLQF